MTNLFEIRHHKSEYFKEECTSPMYQLILFQGDSSFTVDGSEFKARGNTIIFLSPYQTFRIDDGNDTDIVCLSFHGDFYCIEYHKKEVACNGLLFNNIYLFPNLSLELEEYNLIMDLLKRVEEEISKPLSDLILKAYLQLILTICSREKKLLIEKESRINHLYHDELTEIQTLIDNNFLNERSPGFYAESLSMSISSFSKKTKAYFGKTPTQLIQDKVVLEAKKLLHLSKKSVKEIAAILKFEDEFYFSRYFKKCVGLSPARYREQVGISVVAK